ncbi:Hypothetical protein GbCGDNIH2_5088 [Granulibacter bethesdensis]|uniref:Uncharacterized protein n=1 Tax=Granulibacter bethesdensis (strain ATCC BAA-1260 / CGDNIH1) TaxID=391165 RepID=A0A286M305_GRABC|nr:Hypothetical protein GbCGDNIH2_5088 [Granulibacter bethesdensis]APH51813.1 Hypothetical protein GbCGDNIH5_5088 [Granulibacter bethesdensis]APH64505.1 Hypothetical protein GbCGDNIH1I4_5088 [Granulibacter bethesdensis]ASV62404.1 Hypothetical protein GbCGDNIH1_5088 [Granulibacter bethesdensis CGDNIH1]
MHDIFELTMAGHRRNPAFLSLCHKSRGPGLQQIILPGKPPAVPAAVSGLCGKARYHL